MDHSNELITVESIVKVKSWEEYSGGIKTIATFGHFTALPKMKWVSTLKITIQNSLLKKRSI